MHSAKKTPPPPGPIIDYGIAHADNLYALAELVKHQISKGFQPCTASGIQCMPHGEEQIYTQVMVMYKAPVNRKKTAAKTTTKK